MLLFIEDSPVYLLRVSPGKESGLEFCMKKLENLPMGPGVVLCVSRVDLGPAKNALYGDGSS